MVRFTRPVVEFRALCIMRSQIKSSGSGFSKDHAACDQDNWNAVENMLVFFCKANCGKSSTYEDSANQIMNDYKHVLVLYSHFPFDHRIGHS